MIFFLLFLATQAKKAAADGVAGNSEGKSASNKSGGKKATKAREIRIVVPEAACAAVHVAEAVSLHVCNPIVFTLNELFGWFDD